MTTFLFIIWTIIVFYAGFVSAVALAMWMERREMRRIPPSPQPDPSFFGPDTEDFFWPDMKDPGTIDHH